MHNEHLAFPGNLYSPTFDPNWTQRHQTDEAGMQTEVRQAQPSMPPPTPPRRRKPGCLFRLRMFLGCLGQLALAGILFTLLFSMLMAVLYRLAPPPRTNILILGLDARPEEGMVTRSDTIILATVDPARLYAGMLSIPRDLYVEIPGYGLERINAAHVLGENVRRGGGPELAAETIEQDFQVRVHRTLRVNFRGFVAIVDAAGGITVDVKNHIIDYEYPTEDYGTMVVEFQPGVQHMDGGQALEYARIRHDSSDIFRIERQQQVIAALARQLVWPGNWWRLPDVYLAFVQNVDTNLNILDVAMLAPTLLWVGPDGIDHRVLDNTYVTGTVTETGASVLLPQWDKIQPLLDEMFRQ